MLILYLICYFKKFFWISLLVDSVLNYKFEIVLLLMLMLLYILNFLFYIKILRLN